MNVELVIFDMAGTTVRDKKEVETCFAQALKQSGLNISEERILALQGWAKNKVFHLLWAEQIGEDHPEFAEKAAASYSLFRKILENHYKEHPVVPQPFAEDVLIWLKENNIKTALTTGFYREVTDILLKQLGWNKGLDEYYRGDEDSMIDLSICSDDVEKGRPAPDMIHLAMEKLQITDKSKIVNVGDTPSDLQSAEAAKVGLSVGVLNGTHSKSQLESLAYDVLVSDLSGLKEFINTPQKLVI